MMVKTAQRTSPVAPVATGPAIEAPAPAVKFPAPKGMPPSIEMRHPNELEIDDSYQRSTDVRSSQRLIRKIAENWDWRMCQPLVVSRREGGFYVIDGQHRLAAAQMRGDIPFLPCCISTYASVADEAAMFVAMNRTRKAICKLDDFHAAAAGGDPEAVTVRRLIEEAGFTVSRTTGSTSWVPGAIAFTESIKMILRKHGERVCANALGLMAEAFPDEVLNAGASTFRALVKIDIAREGLDRDRLFRALLTENQQGWAGYVSGIKGGGEDRALAMRQAFLMAYDEQPAS
ncbi:DUF6551 family protein [Sphingomonas sanxanigenens]|uniref:Uncharacterized protein n=1 Tax=Sphingomonas sanxanigenens DSM 19645 = NX02 TaxID=1123269 RepID=W0AF04_9SPHN|nr:DUF6551 family protein [Sphingomonas sanxanigenens]AHE55686.1 hypothetical protein NX02_20135 [Sphingomonas sanxanigenens DSM 19645 = NX02]